MRKKEWTLVTGVVGRTWWHDLADLPGERKPWDSSSLVKALSAPLLGIPTKKNPIKRDASTKSHPQKTSENPKNFEKFRRLCFFLKNPDTSPDRIGFFGVPIPSPSHRIIGEIPSLGHTNGSLGQPATRLRSALLLPHLLSFFGSFQIGSLGVESGCGNRDSVQVGFKTQKNESDYIPSVTGLWQPQNYITIYISIIYLQYSIWLHHMYIYIYIMFD